MSEVFMPVHDLGCQCWPHVSQRHADAAIVEAARREYVATRAPDKAVSLQKASPKSGEVSAVPATAPSPALPVSEEALYRALWQSDAIWQFHNPERAEPEDRFRRMARSIAKALAAQPPAAAAQSADPAMVAQYDDLIAALAERGVNSRAGFLRLLESLAAEATK